jgi:hypothetical protein
VWPIKENLSERDRAFQIAARRPEWQLEGISDEDEDEDEDDDEEERGEDVSGEERCGVDVNGDVKVFIVVAIGRAV